jgi:hypothetical protein
MKQNCRHQGAHPGRKKRNKKTSNSHQPLQRRKLDRLNPLPQPRHLLLNPRLRLLNAHLLPIRLLPDPALLQIQIESDRRLGAGDLVAEPAGQLGEIGAEALMGGAGELGFGRVGVHELGAEFGKVDFLRVGASFGVCGRSRVSAAAGGAYGRRWRVFI